MDGLRTRARTLAAAAVALNATTSAPFRLAFLTDPRGPDPECVARALPSGAALILRHYRDPRREGLARRLRALTSARGVLLLIGADAALATRIGADGVHWRSDQLGAPSMRDLRMIVTAACHDADELARAGQAGADAAFLSPVFATQSHPEAEHLGVVKFLALAATAPIPVYALGGVHELNASRLRGPNVAGFGAIDAFAAR
jgi:thiamine-phosphate pyrophosphorylase